MSETTRHSAETVQEQWLMCAYQHGRLDTCEEPQAFASEADAVAAAIEWADSVPSTEAHQHEAVVLRVVSVFRGARTMAHI